jgi:aminopeptidase-like protein
MNLREMKSRMITGFNITCVGDDRAYSLLASKKGNNLGDKVARHVLSHIAPGYIEYDWLQRGSDERQYCSPHIDLPVTSIMRSKYGEYPEYHTSLDDLEHVVTEAGLEGGFKAIKLAIEAIEKNCMPIATNFCEPQLGKRGLYPDLSRKDNFNRDFDLMMGILTYADGNLDLVDIAEKLRAPVWELYSIVGKFRTAGLIK